jgi:Leucine-rich repeat (LRR) protein
MKLDQSFWDKRPPATTKELSLGYLNLTTIPEKLFEYKELTDLSLKGNELTQIPDKIGQLTKLVSINLSNNKLKTLPKGIGALQELKCLWAMENVIDSLPIEFCKLQKLREVTFYNNQLTMLPKDFGQLKSLEILDLCDNKLASLPITFGDLTKMRKLGLRDNLLTTLPDFMSKLENMRELSLKGNKLSLFPECLLAWPKIKYTEWLGLRKFYNGKILKNYFSVRDKYIKKGWEDRNDWLAAFYLLTNQPKELAKLARKNLLKTLFIKHSLINAAALDQIKETNNNSIKKPLTESSSVAVLGKLKEFSEEDLINCLEDRNIAYTFNITEKTTHVLLNIPLETTHLSTIDLIDNLVLINEGSIK